jgi:HAD superfamily hydrolase (TIGR01509 family)
MELRALIFDVDGTLAETEELHRQAFNETFDRLRLNTRWLDLHNGWFWSEEIYRELLKTTGGKERIAVYLRKWLGYDPTLLGEEIAQIHLEKTARLAELFTQSRLRLRPGIQALIDEARARHLSIAVATTTSRQNIELLARACFGQEATYVFDHIAAGEDVANKKPAPDVYLLVLEQLDLPPEACLAFEDSRNGLLAARGAGLRCIVSPSQYMIDEDFSGATMVVPSFDRIVPDWLGSPT